jgi:hypothetical protein
MTTADEHYDNDYQLDCGRWVTIEECYISITTLGILCGSGELLRRRVIERLPERVRSQWPFHPFYIKPVPYIDKPVPEGVYLEPVPEGGGYIEPVPEGAYIKPVPEGKSLPRFVFMVYLVSDLISESPHYHNSHLIVCWLSDDITASLPELIKRETRAIEWNKYAVEFSY